MALLVKNKAINPESKTVACQLLFWILKGEVCDWVYQDNEVFFEECAKIWNIVEKDIGLEIVSNQGSAVSIDPVLVDFIVIRAARLSGLVNLPIQKLRKLGDFYSFCHLRTLSHSCEPIISQFK